MDPLTNEVLRWLRRTRSVRTSAHRALVGTRIQHSKVSEVIDELRSFGARPRLEFIWSGDGSCVEDEQPRTILLHCNLRTASRAPHRVHIHCQRIMPFDLADVARHEVGHSLLMLAPRVARSRRFQTLFGDIRVLYRVGDPFEEVARRIRRSGGLSNPRYRRVVSLYAATHPHERFAEAARVALATRGDSARIAAWSTQYDVHPSVRDQIIFAADWLSSFRMR